MSKRVIGLAVGLALAATPVAAETVKVGFITTLSGPAGIIDKPMNCALIRMSDINALEFKTYT
jgi:hypothetical protein